MLIIVIINRTEVKVPVLPSVFLFKIIVQLVDFNDFNAKDIFDGC